MFGSLFNNSKYSNVLTIILIIAIIGIVVVIGIIGYNIYKKYYIQKGAAEAVAQFEDTSNNNQNLENNGLNNTEISGITDDSQLSTSKTGKTTYKGYEVVATIQIPKINLKYPILEKVTKKSLETSVAKLYGPGLNEVGNNVIVGHNYRNGTMFSNLKKLNNGDAIYITDPSGRKIKYIIYKIYRTSGDDASYMTRNTNGKREISLSTCTDDSKARTIVWAKEE